MSDIYTPTVVSRRRTDATVRLVLGDYIALLDSRQYDPLRALIQGIVMSHLRAGCAVIFGGFFVEYIESDIPALGWREGEHYFPTRLEFWQGPTFAEPHVRPWFFASLPPNAAELDFDQGFANDALCLLTSYKGPANLDEILEGLGTESTEDEIVARLLEHCASVIYVDDDGKGLNLFTKPRPE